MVPVLYNRKPQSISRHVLPLLWNLLSSSSNGSAATNNSVIRISVSQLTTVLHSIMGRALREQASNQSPKIQEKLHEFIGLWPKRRHSYFEWAGAMLGTFRLGCSSIQVTFQLFQLSFDVRQSHIVKVTTCYLPNQSIGHAVNLWINIRWKPLK